MPVRFRRPTTVEEAQVLVGSAVNLYWIATKNVTEGWYPGEITEVQRFSDEDPSKLFLQVT